MPVKPVMPPPAGFTAAQMIFQDTFNGTSLNLAKWNPALGANNQLWNNEGKLGKDAQGFPYTGPNTPTTTESELCAKSQIAVNKGLTITTVPNPNNVGGQGYQAITGNMITHTPPGSGPGVTAGFTLPSTGTWYVQIRCKCPNMAAGIQPALWFMPAIGNAGTELDFLQGGLHPGGNANNYPVGTGFVPSVATPNVGFDASAAFHVYGIKLVWGGTVTCFADGTRVASFSAAGKTACGYEIILGSLAWLKGLSWAVGYGGGTSQFQVAEIQAYSAP